MQTQRKFQRSAPVRQKLYKSKILSFADSFFWKSTHCYFCLVTNHQIRICPLIISYSEMENQKDVNVQKRPSCNQNGVCYECLFWEFRSWSSDCCIDCLTQTLTNSRKGPKNVPLSKVPRHSLDVHHCAASQRRIGQSEEQMFTTGCHGRAS